MTATWSPLWVSTLPEDLRREPNDEEVQHALKVVLQRDVTIPNIFFTRPDWQHDGACRDADPRIFFSNSTRRIEEAKAICGDCPVRQECLEWATDNGEVGTWGGTTTAERRARKRPAA